MPQFNHQSWISHPSGWVISLRGKSLVFCAHSIYSTSQRVTWSDLTLREPGLVYPCQKSSCVDPDIWNCIHQSLSTQKTFMGWLWLIHKNAKGINSQKVFLKKKIRHHCYLWQRSNSHLTVFILPLSRLVILVLSRHKLQQTVWYSS